jgi:hypothetical protein
VYCRASVARAGAGDAVMFATNPPCPARVSADLQRPVDPRRLVVDHRRQQLVAALLQGRLQVGVLTGHDWRRERDPDTVAGEHEVVCQPPRVVNDDQQRTRACVRPRGREAPLVDRHVQRPASGRVMALAAAGYEDAYETAGEERDEGRGQRAAP